MSGCRELCAASGEPLAGSAGSAQLFAAISWPKRLWHHDKAALSEGLPPGLAELEDRAKQAGRKLSLRVFQRGPGTGTDAVELLVYRHAAAGFRAVDLAPDALIPILEAVIAGHTPDVATAPLSRELLVCTDGRHDDCCARFGRPLYRALVDAVAAQEGAWNVSECSHLGGHRFAGNLLQLPQGHLYGRLEPADAKPLLAAAQAERVLRYRYRGQLGASEPCQVADAFLASRVPDGSSWEIEGEADGADDTRAVRARVRGPDGERAVRVRCEARRFTGPGSCDEEDEERLRWVAVDLEERAL